MILWGDLHNHCGITYGFGSLENALHIAKNHLDFCCITGHAMWPDMYARCEETAFIVDFHNAGFAKLRANWMQIRQTIALANTDDFFTFQSYEIHSSTYGDHHIVSPDDNLPLIERNSPAQLVRDCGVEAIAVPHHIAYTPRYRGIDWNLFSQAISPCVEVYSKHGCSMRDSALYAYYHDMGPRDPRNTVFAGMQQGHRFSFLGSTDHHAGFPGSYGDGLTAVVVKKKTKQAVWDALRQGRTYAVTGDRIVSDFTLNGATLGETVTAEARNVRCAVIAEDTLDKIVLYKNCVPVSVLCGEQLPQKKPARYKLRVEMGWGNSEELTPWEGVVTTTGRICGENGYWRGRSLLSPTNHDGRPGVVNQLDCKLLERDTHSVRWRCQTVRNKSTLHPQTDAVVVEIEGEPNATITVTVNGVSHTHTVEALLKQGYSWHQKYYHAEAVLVHTIVPDTQYEAVLEFADTATEQLDAYHVEITQKNGQMAFLSPIYAIKPT